MEDEKVVELKEEKVTMKEKLAIGWQKAKPVVTGIAVGAGALLLVGILKALGDDEDETEIDVDSTEIDDEETVVTEK